MNLHSYEDRTPHGARVVPVLGGPYDGASRIIRADDPDHLVVAQPGVEHHYQLVRKPDATVNPYRFEYVGEVARP